MDITKLTPLSESYWMDSDPEYDPRRLVDVTMSHADWEFCCVARRAIEIMMRRGWNPTRRFKGDWYVETIDGKAIPILPNLDRGLYPDPYTAIVEADKWYVANVEAK